jgi:membrane peptidoglycan carboxypeptidase
MLGMPRLYEVDRLDATATSTIDRELQDRVTQALSALATPAGAAAAGLREPRLLAGVDPPGCLRTASRCSRRTAAGNVVRVQTDNVDQPFDSRGLRLDLGSTAKLRTLVTYLEIVARLHERRSAHSTRRRCCCAAVGRGPLTRWAADHLLVASRTQPRSTFLAARWSAVLGQPARGFVTGGSVLRFENFDRDDDARTVTVREAFRRSVNLVFVRLMQDVVEHTIAHARATSRGCSPTSPIRVGASTSSASPTTKVERSCGASTRATRPARSRGGRPAAAPRPRDADAARVRASLPRARRDEAAFAEWVRRA